MFESNGTSFGNSVSSAESARGKNISINESLINKKAPMDDEASEDYIMSLNTKLNTALEGEQLSTFTKAVTPSVPEYPTNIPRHTEASPTKIFVQITDVGHKEASAPNAYGRCTTFFAPGPDANGAVSANISIKNLRGKTLKTINVFVTPLNANGSAEICKRTGESTRCVVFSGPVQAGSTISGSFDNAWYNESITAAKIAYVIVQFIDGSQELYTEDDVKQQQQPQRGGFYPGAQPAGVPVNYSGAPQNGGYNQGAPQGFNRPAAQPGYAQPGYTPQRQPGYVQPGQPGINAGGMAQNRGAGASSPATPSSDGYFNLFIQRNQTALVTTTNKLNRLTCVLSTGERVEVGLGETVCVPVKCGTYSIKFEFWGGGLVPAKNKKTPEFTVTGNTCIKLTPDVIWGGYTTEIYQT